MDQIPSDCSSSGKIIKQLSPLGASTAHYAITTSLMLKFPPLISFSKINDTAPLGSWLGLCSVSAAHGAFSVCLSNVPGNVHVALIWRFHISWAGRYCSFAATHNSWPVGHGIAAVLAQGLGHLAQDTMRGPWSPHSLVIEFLAPPQTCHWDFRDISS